MNLEQLQAKLLAAARKNIPSDHVPFAFEKRIMAHLPRPIADVWELWSRALWRAAAVSVLAMALLGGWSFQTVSNENPDLSEEFENTVYASFDEQLDTAIDEETW